MLLENIFLVNGVVETLQIFSRTSIGIRGIDSIVLGAVCVVLYDKEQAPRGTSSTVRMLSDKAQAPRGTSIANMWD